MNSLVLYFSGFDLFAGGLMGFFSLFAFFYVFSFTSVRGQFEHPWEKALELLLPTFITALFLNFLGLPQIVVGFIVVIVYAFSMKQILDMKTRAWVIAVIKLYCLLGIFGLLDMWSRNILFIIYLAYNAIMSEKRLVDKEHKKDEKSDKK